jgi:hypothetical protein
MNSFVFLDIDGVLNRHKKLSNGYCGIVPSCRNNLNRITDVTGAKLVISSAWRYQILLNDMTLKGFQNMLRTHGVKGDVVGATRLDTMIPNPHYRPGVDPDWMKTIPLPDERGLQIHEWIVGEGWKHYGEDGQHVVIDDGGLNNLTGEWTDLGITAAGHPFVRTIGSMGLTLADARRAIETLWHGAA